MNKPVESEGMAGEATVAALSAGFAGLYDEHSRAIFYLTLRYLGDPQKAQDATHDVFLKAFRKQDQFRGEASVRTWLYRIAINHCQNLNQSWHNRNIHSNADEMRELKAQLYKLLLPSVQGKEMVEVAERLIKVRTS